MDENSQYSPNGTAFPSKGLLFSLAALLIVAVGVVAYTQAQSPNTDSDDSISTEVVVSGDEMASETVNATAQADPASSEMVDNMGLKVVQVQAGSFYYTPNEIRVKKGETVRIEMSSLDMMHNFIIDELGVELPITKAGETASVEFTPEQVGEFEFYCSVGNHRAQGQVGTMIVEE